MRLLNSLGAKVVAALTFISLVATTIVAIFDARDRLWPPVEDETVATRPAPPIIVLRDRISPLASQVAEDLRARLAHADCSGVSLAISGATSRATPESESTSRLPATYLQTDLHVETSSGIDLLTVRGSGLGPAAAQDAYRAMLQDLLQQLSTAVPTCFD